MRQLEKRLYPRKKSRIKVYFEDEFGNPIIFLRSRDISVGGIFLEGNVPIKIGSCAFLRFFLPDEEDPIRCTAKIVRLVHRRDGVEGFGAEFIDISNFDVERIKRFLS